MDFLAFLFDSEGKNAWELMNKQEDVAILICKTGDLANHERYKQHQWEEVEFQHDTADLPLSLEASSAVAKIIDRKVTKTVENLVCKHKHCEQA